MSRPGNPLPCLYFCGCIHGESALTPEVLSRLQEVIGPVGWQSNRLPFTATNHYDDEMGPHLFRTFLFSDELSPVPEKLIQAKRKAAEVEQAFVHGGRRTVNVDPGYLNAHQVVIATFKDFTHRIYLGEGIWAHLEYVFKAGQPVPLRWTYPDFTTESYRAIFARAREEYKKKWEVQDLNL